MKASFLPATILGAVIMTIGSCKKSTPADVVVPSPQIQSFTPASGAEGAFVVISGTGFSPISAENTVIFNGDTAKILSANSTSLVVVVPVAAGTGKITVKGAGGSSSSGNNFTYLASVVNFVGGTYGFRDDTGPYAQVTLPAGFAADGDGNFYFTDEFNNRIRKMTKAGVVTTFAGDGTRSFRDGTADQAEFNFPTGIAVDATGNIYVSDGGNSRIRKITPAGVVSTLAGNGMIGYAEGSGASAKFNNPSGLVVDATGNVYVADMGNNRIRKITPAGVVSTLSGTGVSGFANGGASVAQYNTPNGLAIDAAGTIYLADQGNERIRKITPAGVASTLAGNGMPGLADGPGTTAQFSQPVGICVDGSGNVYVADESNNRLRKVTPAGDVTTVAGGGSGNGPVNTAGFSELVSVAVDANGFIYIGDSGAVRIIR